MVERNRLEVLKPDAMADVRAAASNITLNPHLARAFTGGAAEVSVFWVDEDGIACKARHDYVKPRTLVNLKKFANQRQRPVDLAIDLAIAEYRYDLQAAHYLDSYPHMHSAACDGRVFGDCPLPAGWARQIAAPEAIVYSWIFHQMDGPPVTVGRQIAPNSPTLNRAIRDRQGQAGLRRLPGALRLRALGSRRADRQQVAGSDRRALPIDESFQDHAQPKISERARSTAPANGHGGNGRMSY